MENMTAKIFYQSDCNLSSVFIVREQGIELVVVENHERMVMLLTLRIQAVM